MTLNGEVRNFMVLADQNEVNMFERMKEFNVRMGSELNCNLIQIFEKMADILEARNDLSNVPGMLNELALRLNELDARMNRGPEEEQKLISQCIQAELGPIAGKLDEMLLKRELPVRIEPDLEIQEEARPMIEEIRPRVTIVDGDLINAWLMEADDARKFMGRLENEGILVENRRVKKTRNPRADLMNIFTNTRAIPDPERDCCYCHDPQCCWKREIKKDIGMEGSNSAFLRLLGCIWNSPR